MIGRPWARGEQVRTRSDLMAITALRRSQFDDRHLDAVVSRLRRKIERGINHPIPLQVVHSVGYVFTAPVLVECNQIGGPCPLSASGLTLRRLIAAASTDIDPHRDR